MKSYFSNRQRELYHAYKAAKSLGHSLPVGNERELIAKEFLAKHLPDLAIVTQGIIIDQNNVDFSRFNQSNTPQIDLLIYISHCPKLTFYGGSNIYLSEGVASVLEVKTKLNKAEYSKAIKHCRKVKNNHRQIFGLYWATNDPTSAPGDRIPYYLITFDSINEDIVLSYLGSEQDNTSDISEMPDGFFCLNPKNGFVIIKRTGLHPNFGNHPKLKSNKQYIGMKFYEDTLSILWTIILSQIDAIKDLRFPYKSYANSISKLMKP